MNRANRASLHVRVDGQWASFTRRNADAQAPAGGASSNARDMAQWLRCSWPTASTTAAS